MCSLYISDLTPSCDCHVTLAGSTMSSNIGRLMLDMLLESSAHVQDIAQFFLIFVKLKDAITSKAFRVRSSLLWVYFELFDLYPLTPYRSMI